MQAYLTDNSRHVEANAKPIADQFENVTVLFADLAGFTRWSSSRNSEDVFRLKRSITPLIRLRFDSKFSR